MRRRAERALALVLALALVMSVAAVAPLAGHADHDCAGEDCPVCDWLARCEGALVAAAVGLLTLAVSVTLLFRPTAPPRRPLWAGKRTTPVLLGVRLRN